MNLNTSENSINNKINKINIGKIELDKTKLSTIQNTNTNKDGNIPLFKNNEKSSISLFSTDSNTETQSDDQLDGTDYGNLLLTGSPQSNMLYDLGPIQKLQDQNTDIDRYFYYIEALIKTDDIIKKENGFMENFSIFISEEINEEELSKYREIISDTDENTKYYGINTDRDTIKNLITNGISIEYDFNNYDTKDIIKIFVINNSYENNYTTYNLLNYKDINTDNEYNIFSIILNPAYTVKNTQSDKYINDSQGFQLFYNHILMQFDNTGIVNDLKQFISIPYISNPHIYVFIPKQQLSDGSNLNSSFRTTMLFNTTFDRFIYRDFALSYYQGDLDPNKSSDSINYFNLLDNYTYYSMGNINSEFPITVNDLIPINNPNSVTIRNISDYTFNIPDYKNDKYNSVNGYSKLTKLDNNLNEQTGDGISLKNNIHLEFISNILSCYNNEEGNDSEYQTEYVFIGSTSSGFCDYGLNGEENSNQYTNISSYQYLYNPTIKDIEEHMFTDGSKYLQPFSTTIPYKDGIFICKKQKFLFTSHVCSNAYIYVSIIAIDSDGNLKNIYNFKDTVYINNNSIINYDLISLQFIDIDFVNKTLEIIINDNSSSVTGSKKYNSYQEVLEEENRDRNSIYIHRYEMMQIPSDFHYIFDKMVASDNVCSTFIVHNSNYPKNSYLNIGSNKYFIKPDSTAIRIKSKNYLNNRWKQTIPYLDNLRLNFTYKIKDNAYIIPIDFIKEEKSNFKLSIEFPPTGSYNVRYWVAIGSGIGFSHTETSNQQITNINDGMILVLDDTNSKCYYMLYKGQKQVQNNGGFSVGTDFCQQYGMRMLIWRDCVEDEENWHIWFLTVDFVFGYDKIDLTKLKNIIVHPEYIGSDQLEDGADLGYVVFNSNPDDNVTEYTEVGNKLLSYDSLKIEKDIDGELIFKILGISFPLYYSDLDLSTYNIGTNAPYTVEYLHNLQLDSYVEINTSIYNDKSYSNLKYNYPISLYKTYLYGELQFNLNAKDESMITMSELKEKYLNKETWKGIFNYLSIYMTIDNTVVNEINIDNDLLISNCEIVDNGDECYINFKTIQNIKDSTNITSILNYGDSIRCNLNIKWQTYNEEFLVLIQENILDLYIKISNELLYS